MYTIKDRVKVPNLEPGNYTISWRWDCEVSPQVWTNCGDITIKFAELSVARGLDFVNVARGF